MSKGKEQELKPKGGLSFGSGVATKFAIAGKSTGKTANNDVVSDFPGTNLKEMCAILNEMISLYFVRNSINQSDFRVDEAGLDIKQESELPAEITYEPLTLSNSLDRVENMTQTEIIDAHLKAANEKVMRSALSMLAEMQSLFAVEAAAIRVINSINQSDSRADEAGLDIKKESELPADPALRLSDEILVDTDDTMHLGGESPDHDI